MQALSRFVLGLMRRRSSSFDDPRNIFSGPLGLLRGRETTTHDSRRIIKKKRRKEREKGSAVLLEERIQNRSTAGAIAFCVLLRICA